MTRRLIISLATIVLVLTTSISAQQKPPTGSATSLPPEFCPIPTSPEIVVTAITDEGQPINVWAVLYKKNADGVGEWAGSTSCDGPTSQGCFENGKAKFTKDQNGNALTAGDYMVMAYPQLWGYDQAIADWAHVENGTLVMSVVLRRQTVSIMVDQSTATAKQGYVNYELIVNGSLPPGTDLYTVTSATGWTGQSAMWESSRKAFTGGGFGQERSKQSFVAPNALAGFQICTWVYLAQRGSPLTPVAQTSFCVNNVK